MTAMRQSGERTSGLATIFTLAALAVIALILFLPPHGVLDKADRAAFAVCHRIEARTFSIAGRPLPLCARCSGSYLAALGALAVLALRGRTRADRPPPRPYLLLFGVFLAAWAFDGFNSFLALFPELPHLYEPRNSLRLLTGTLQGVALAAILLPMINQGFRAGHTEIASVSSMTDLVWLLATGGLVVLAVSSDWAALLYPLAILSELAVVGFASLLNALFLTTLSDSGQIGWLRARAPRVALGVALALIELTAVALARGALEARLGPPF
jgi:uncharacterized membrane protein